MAVLVAVILYAQLVYGLFERNTARVRSWIKPYVMGAKTVLPFLPLRPFES
jgi:hypothetical protein